MDSTPRYKPSLDCGFYCSLIFPLICLGVAGACGYGFVVATLFLTKFLLGLSCFMAVFTAIALYSMILEEYRQLQSPAVPIDFMNPTDDL